MGLKRRRIAHTQLNTESSRSHSVLSMRLVQFHNDIPPTSLVYRFFLFIIIYKRFFIVDKR